MGLVGNFKKNRKKSVEKWGFRTDIIFKKKNEIFERTCLCKNIGFETEMFKKKKQKKYKNLCLSQKGTFQQGLAL